ncbi:MAG TPA: hypothetical protein PK248_00455, partial [Treponemataceae bacterium]|nr:hypothetical protein [Treponemataceae bacterium]
TTRSTDAALSRRLRETEIGSKIQTISVKHFLTWRSKCFTWNNSQHGRCAFKALTGDRNRKQNTNDFCKSDFGMDAKMFHVEQLAARTLRFQSAYGRQKSEAKHKRFL